MAQIQSTTLHKTPVHSLSVDERKLTKMTGVEEVINYSDTVIDIRTTHGTIVLKGKDLSISKLDTDVGELCINGEINSLQYSKTKQKRSALEGLLR